MLIEHHLIKQIAAIIFNRLKYVSSRPPRYITKNRTTIGGDTNEPTYGCLVSEMNSDIHRRLRQKRKGALSNVVRFQQSFLFYKFDNRLINRQPAFIT